MARIPLIRRSAIKAITYRLVIMTLDFASIYFFTGAVKIAVGFMVVSNIYTTVAYFAHERLWSRIPWGLEDTPP